MAYEDIKYSCEYGCYCLTAKCTLCGKTVEGCLAGNGMFSLSCRCRWSSQEYVSAKKEGRKQSPSQEQKNRWAESPENPANWTQEERYRRMFCMR